MVSGLRPAQPASRQRNGPSIRGVEAGAVPDRERLAAVRAHPTIPRVPSRERFQRWPNLNQRVAYFGPGPLTGDCLFNLSGLPLKMAAAYFAFGNIRRKSSIGLNLSF